MRYRPAIFIGLFLLASKCLAQQIAITATVNKGDGVSIIRTGSLAYTIPPDLDTCIKEVPVIFMGNDPLDSLHFVGANVTYSNGKVQILSRGVFYMDLYWQGGHTVHQAISVGPQIAPVIIAITPAANNNCDGETVKYTANVYAAHNKTLYQWQQNGITVGTSAPVYTGAMHSNDKLKLTVTNFDICTTPTNSKTIDIPQLTPSTTHSVTVTASENPLCGVHPVTYTATTSNSTAGMVYQWQLNGNNVGENKATYTLANPRDSDRVTCTIGNLGKCILPITSSVLLVRVGEVPGVKFSGNAAITSGTSLQLQPVIKGHVSSYLWTPANGLSDATIVNPIASPTSSTKYKLTVFSPTGCLADASLLVKVVIVVPNTFTPNGDGVNDTWQIPAIINNPDYTLQVFNRLGGLVFQSINYSKNWDGTYNGKAISAGTYYYVIKNKIDGDSTSGSVTIIR